MSTKPADPTNEGPTARPASAGGEKLDFRNSTIALERGPAGVIARVEKPGRRNADYAGPLPEETLRALRQVSQ